MSEGHGDPASDVRSFLPRPGEPVEEYAERLRALHRDLTLVLEAVERGLAAASEPASVPPPVPDRPRETVPTRRATPEPRADGPRPAPGPPRGPRVEVLPPPTGEHRRVDEDRRRPDAAPEPPPVPVETVEPEVRFTPTPPRPAPRFPARPSDLDGHATAEPEWVEREPAQQFTTPTLPSAGVTMSRPLLAAFGAAWLVVVVLLVLVLVLG